MCSSRWANEWTAAKDSLVGVCVLEGYVKMVVGV